MNWFMSIIFLILMVFLYQFIGDTFFLRVKKKRNKEAFNMIGGFIITWCLGWIIGFPCELVSTSWKVFSIIYSLSFIALIIICGLLQLKFNEEFKSFLVKENKEKFIAFKSYLNQSFKKYWFIYLLTIIFTLLSVTNMQPYTLNNYQDDHYIVRIIRMCKSNMLFNEDYYTGNILEKTSMFSLAIQQGQRMFNTYELMYSFFGSIFHINLVFFCRVTMTLHNYLIVFSIFQLLSSIFIRSKYSQFGVLCFSVLLIPSGYLAKSNFPIKVRMWENWRFQTAMYMGGSLVRVGAFPLIIYNLYAWFYDKKIRLLLFFVPISITLLSFQTTAISFILLMLPILLIAILYEYLMSKFEIKKEKNSKYLMTLITVIAIILTVAFVSSDVYLKKSAYDFSIKLNFLNHREFNINYINKLVKEYSKYYNNVFSFDTFARLAFLPLIVLFFLCKDLKQRIIIVVASILYIIFAFNKATFFISIISFESYCAARMLTGMEIILIGIVGICLVKLCCLFPSRKFIVPTISVSLILINLSVIKLNFADIIKYTEEGDGIVKLGYNANLLNDKNLVPTFYSNIGRYISSKEKNKVYLFCEDKFKIKGITYTKLGFLIASKNIQVGYNADVYKNKQLEKQNKSLNWCFWLLSNFSENSNMKKSIKTYNQAKTYFRNAKLCYIFTTRKNVMKILKNDQWKVVITNKSEDYWLLYKNNR